MNSNYAFEIVRKFFYLISTTKKKRDEYIVKVLLPEALIKICMRIHQCSKLVAESYLEKYNFTKPLEWTKFKSTLSI